MGMDGIILVPHIIFVSLTSKLFRKLTCIICDALHDFHNFKNVKNAHGGVFSYLTDTNVAKSRNTLHMF